VAPQSSVVLELVVAAKEVEVLMVSDDEELD
jgi:hypothetical protein